MTFGELAGHILDVPALVDLGRRDTFYMRALVVFARDRGHTLAVPAAALAGAAAHLDPPSRTELAWALEMPHLLVLPLDAGNALTVGAAAADDLEGDIVTGHVAEAALDRGWPVVTSAKAADLWRRLGIQVQLLP